MAFLATVRRCLQSFKTMGGCMGMTPSREERDTFDLQPTDTASLDPSSCPTLSFKALLTKLKLKWCSHYKFVSIRINFGKYQQFQLKSKFIGNETAKWDIYHEFDFKASEYDLRKEFMLLTIFDQENHLLGSLKINLFLLATGPYHQDFAIPLSKADKARISFNLKIAQEVVVKLQVKEATMIPKDRQFPGDIFAFALNSIIGDRLDQSALSYKYLVAFREGEVEEEAQRGIDRRLDRKKTLGQNIGENCLAMRKAVSNYSSELQSKKNESKTIEWSEKNSSEMPSLQTIVPLFDLHGASFNIIFYAFRNKVKEFSSECFISYNKLANFQAQEKIDSIAKKTFEDRSISLEVKTWNHGKETGKAKFTILFTIEKHIKQMQLCVRTEKGILESSPVFGESSGSRIPEELEQLQKLGNEIQNQFILVSKTLKKTEGNKWVSEVNKRLIRMQEILSSSSKESKLMFIYQDENSLLKGQRGMIEIGKRIRSLLDEDKDDIAQNCWRLLISLIKRAELSLHYMGFTKKQREQCLNGDTPEYLHRKKEVALSYHILLVDLLQRTLKSLEAYNYESQREFAELFCAYAYFRLPKFRKEVLTAITRNDDPEIEEWRGTEYSLTEGMQSTERETSFKLMFDWENNFYNMIESEEDYSKTEAKLMELMRTNDWEIRMKKRGGAFFAFVRYWVTYIESIVVNSKHISWRYFPGYNKILLSFFAQMKLRPLQGYSQNMKKAAASLLSNEKLLNPFVLIIFRKTDENDQLAIVKAFDLVSIFISSIQGRGRSLPSTFDYKLLTKAITGILQGEAAFAIGKVLLVLYDNFMVFPVEFRLQISSYLFTKVFFKLFLHWSFNVRTIFHHLLFIRIYHQNSKPLNQLDFKEQDIFRHCPEYRNEIVSRYKKLMLILQNAQQFQHKIRERKVDYERELYKKLRKKVQEKRKEKNNPQPPVKKQFQNKSDFSKQLMRELSEPKLDRYNSEVMSRTLKIVVENRKETPLKEEVIVRNTTSKKSLDDGRWRKLSVTEINFQQQLVSLLQEQIPYIRNALDEYSKINETFIKNLERNKDSVPVVRLQLALDEKEMRPEGLSEIEEW